MAKFSKQPVRWSWARDLVLRGGAVGAGLVQLVGGMASGIPESIPSTDVRVWKRCSWALHSVCGARVRGSSTS